MVNEFVFYETDQLGSRRIPDILNEAGNDIIWVDISSDENEDDNSQVSDHETDAEQSRCSDEDEINVIRLENSFCG